MVCVASVQFEHSASAVRAQREPPRVGVGREGHEGRRAGEEERKARGVVENGDAGRDAGRELVSKVIRYSMRYGGGLMCLLFLDVILFA